MIYIIGLGSHADVVESILQNQYIQDEIKKIDFQIFFEKTKLEIYQELNLLPESNFNTIIAIGDNFLRKKIADKINNLISNVIWINAISSNSIIISDRKDIGVGNVICPGVTVQAKSKIGNHNIINTNASIDHHNDIRNFVHIAPQSCLCGNVTVHDLVFIGSNTTIVPRITIPPVKFIKAGTLVKESMPLIPIYIPNLKNYKNSAIDAINSEWISNHGKYIALATDALKVKLSAKYVILMNNGTTATHCIFLALKYKYPNIKKLYVPNNTYIAACNMALMEFDMSQLEILKINEETWNMETSEEYIKTLDQGAAVLIVHNIGGIINVARLKQLRPDLIFVEDACEGIFGKYDNQYVGASDASLAVSFSFYGNKIITTGEGGAFLTTDKDVYGYINKIYSQGMSSKRYVHDLHAFNYRMTNIQAGFLYDQLNDLDTVLHMKDIVFKNYNKLLEPLIEENVVSLQLLESNTERSNWIYALRFNGKPEEFDIRTEYFKHMGIDIRPFFYPLEVNGHMKELKYHDESNRDLAEKLNKEIIMIPSSPNLTIKEQEYIVDIISRYLHNK
jgi:perosamine synthetase